MPWAKAPSVHEPDESVHVTSDEPAFDALTVPVAPASNAVTTTVRVGVVSDVLSSVLDTPESLAASRFGTPIALGAVVSTTIWLEPAMLLVPVGRVVEVIALPAVSATVPIVKLETVKSAEVWPAATV